MKTYSLDFREKIVKTYDQGGISQQDLAERFCVSVFFVKKLFRQRRSLGTIAPLAKSGWQKGSITGEMQEFLVSLCQENQKLKLQEIADCLEEKYGFRLSSSTICRAVKRLNLRRKIKKSEF
jgi:transposase